MAQFFSQRQQTSQVQTQRMGQRQIQALKMLAMSADDLREEIYAQVEKNPALEIYDDGFESGEGLDESALTDTERGEVEARAFSERQSDYSSRSMVGVGAEERAQAFNEILEARADERKTLYSHLTEQLNVANVEPRERALCKKIIGNLDDRGFFIFAPVTLVNVAQGEDIALLARCIKIVQGFEPSGICVANTEESLLLQARQKGGATSATIFLLDGHLDFLNPPVPQKVWKKTQDFARVQKGLVFGAVGAVGTGNSAEEGGGKIGAEQVEKFTVEDIQRAIDFIKELDPIPARNFSLGQVAFIAPDIYVEKIPREAEALDFQKGAVPLDENFSFKVKIADHVVPKVRISSDFAAAKNSSDFARDAVKSASVFLESLEFRNTTIARAACVIVSRQREFFKNGAGHLSPLRQQDVAREVGVHESTISRMALSKYIQCEWGLFPVKYFFTNALGGKTGEAAASDPSPDTGASADRPVSKDAAKFAIRQILLENAGSAKPLSDQKIADLLAERGINVARRTVAKYRSQLNISSSFDR